MDYDEIDSLLDDEVVIQQELKSIQLKRSFLDHNEPNDVSSDYTVKISRLEDCYSDPVLSDEAHKLSTAYDVHDPGFHSTIPLSLNFIPVTSLRGDRLYLEMVEPREWHSDSLSSIQVQSSLTKENPKRSIEDIEMTNFDFAMLTCAADYSGVQWVDKYRPEGFADLLSDPSVNKFNYV